MQEHQFSRLAEQALTADMERRAVPFAVRDEMRKHEARALIDEQIKAMRDRGEALTLSEEEMKLLESFRRFKLRMRRDGEIFTWQTRRPDGIQVVTETAEIIHPNER